MQSIPDIFPFAESEAISLC